MKFGRASERRLFSIEELSIYFYEETQEFTLLCFFMFHGVRFFLGMNPFNADFIFPAAVRGPVDIPPCRRHLPLSHKSLLLQGVPARVFAPQVIPRNSGGKGIYSGRIASLNPLAIHASNLLLLSAKYFRHFRCRSLLLIQILRQSRSPVIGRLTATTSRPMGIGIIKAMGHRHNQTEHRNTPYRGVFRSVLIYLCF